MQEFLRLAVSLIIIPVAMGSPGITGKSFSSAANNGNAYRADSLTPVTPAQADSAWSAFNRHFYNTSENLYYNASDKSGRAAIWTQAIFWDMAMDEMQRANSKESRRKVADIYQGALNIYDRFNWQNHKTWFIYDDMMWWIISLARAHELTGKNEYLEHALEGFDYVWKEAYDPVEGGMFWQFEHKSKQACINFPAIIAALRLYNISKDKSYLQKAITLYEWSNKNLVDKDQGRVADNRNANGGLGFSDYTYNQGTYIGAATMLYQATGDEKYLKNARAAADYTHDKMCNDAGVLPAEGDWNEQGVLKAIFAQYMYQLIDVTKDQEYLAWMKYNASLAWQHRDPNRTILFRNYAVRCPSGTIQSYEGSSGVRLMILSTIH